MNKQAFLSISYDNKVKLGKEIDKIVSVLTRNGFDTIVFVQKYSYSPSQEKKMMRKALEEIDKCDIFLAEVSKKAIGVGIEIGYAKALSKPILYLKTIDSDYSTTVAGVADEIISYTNLDNLDRLLAKALLGINK